MKHFATPAFWTCYRGLPAHVRELANKNYQILKENSQHPSLRLKKVGRYWSVRIGLNYRALAIDMDEGLLWFWIGNHSEYDRLLK